MSAAAGRSRAFCIRISEKRCHRHQAKTSCELYLYCFSLICLCSYQFSFMVSAVCCLFFVSQLEMSIFKSDGSSKDLTSERMHRWRHTQKGTNTPKQAVRCCMDRWANWPLSITSQYYHRHYNLSEPNARNRCSGVLQPHSALVPGAISTITDATVSWIPFTDLLQWIIPHTSIRSSHQGKLTECKYN